MLKSLLTLTAALYLGVVAAAAPSAATLPFQLLQAGDAPQGECGTYVHAKGTEPGAESTRLFMTTDQVLYLRTADGVRKLELERVDQKLRVKDVLGRGDTLGLAFKAAGKERAHLAATVTEAVVDDDGDYPLIAFDIKATYTSPAGVKVPASDLVAHDTCL
jgi:hypothetical protein